MDNLTFIEKIVNSLAWPLTIVAVVLVFRGPLRDLIGRVRRLKVKGVDVTLAEVQNRLLEASQDLPVPKELVVPPSSKTAKRLHETPLNLADHAVETVVPTEIDVVEMVEPIEEAGETPRQIIEQAWQRLQGAAKQRAARNSGQEPVSVRDLMRTLESAGDLPAEVFHGIQELEEARKKLRKRTKPIGRSVALSFARTADRIILALQDW